MTPVRAMVVSEQRVIKKDKKEFRTEFASFTSVFSVTGRESFLPASGMPVSVEKALRDLDNIIPRAREDGDLEPSEELKQEAEVLVRVLPRHAGMRLYAYPMSEGEIVIHAASSAVKGSVLLTLHPDGPAWCNVLINGRSRRAWYADTGDWPDGFIREALAELVGFKRMGALIWGPREWWEWLSNRQSTQKISDKSQQTLSSGPPSE